MLPYRPAEQHFQLSVDIAMNRRHKIIEMLCNRTCVARVGFTLNFLKKIVNRGIVSPIRRVLIRLVLDLLEVRWQDRR